MKKESSRTGSQSRPIAGRHQFEHEQPTVIHDPEENMMVLARWTRRALKNPVRFWGTIGAVAAGLLTLVLASNLVFTSSSGDSETWSKLESARTASDRLKIAEDFPGTPAALWARLQAATEFYNQGFADLPNNRDVALPTLKKALDSFNEVAKDAPKDSIQARFAAMGKARTLEARNELEKAINQYHLIEKTWPGSMEADQARQLAAAIEKPEAASYYKELYAFTPAKVTLPPLGSQDLPKLNLPLEPAPGSGMGPGSSSRDIMPGSSMSIPLLPPPPPSPVSRDQPAPTASAETKQPAPLLPEAPLAPGAEPSPPKTSAASNPSSTASAADKTESKPPAPASGSNSP